VDIHYEKHNQPVHIQTQPASAHTNTTSQCAYKHNQPVRIQTQLASAHTNISTFEKYSNNIFHENPSSGSRVVPCGQTDRHDEANSRFSQYWERA